MNRLKRSVDDIEQQALVVNLLSVNAQSCFQSTRLTQPLLLFCLATYFLLSRLVQLNLITLEHGAIEKETRASSTNQQHLNYASVAEKQG